MRSSNNNNSNSNYNRSGNHNQMVPAARNNSQQHDPFSRDLMSFGMDNDPFFAGFGNMHNQMMSNFSQMSQALMKGSPFGSDFFESSSMFPSAFREEDIFGFSNIHDKLNQRSIKGSSGNSGGAGGNNGQFQVYSQSMVSRQVMGEDGKPRIEKFYNDNRVHRGADGNTVSEGKQAYHNQANGRSIVAHERMLNDQGHKTVKERNKHGEIHDQNLYHNIEEEQAQDFHGRWSKQATNLQSIQGPTQRMMQLQNNNNSSKPGRQQQMQLEPEYPMRQSNTYQQQQQQQQQQSSYQRPGYESPALSHVSGGSNRSQLSNSSQQRNPMASNVRGFQDMNAAQNSGSRRR